MRRTDDFERLRGEMEELFAELCRVPRLVAPRRGFRPRVDLYRTDDPAALTLVVELPGVDPDEVDLTVADGVLTVSGTRPRAARGCAVYRHMELDHGPFERRVPLGERVDTDAVEAEYDRGLLRVTLPLVSASSVPVQVPVHGRKAS